MFGTSLATLTNRNEFGLDDIMLLLKVLDEQLRLTIVHKAFIV